MLTLFPKTEVFKQPTECLVQYKDELNHLSSQELLAHCTKTKEKNKLKTNPSSDFLVLQRQNCRVNTSFDAKPVAARKPNNKNVKIFLICFHLSSLMLSFHSQVS